MTWGFMKNSGFCPSLLNLNFLLAHRNRYLEGADDRQITPRGYPNFNSYVKNLRVLLFQTDRWTDSQMDGRTEKLIRGGLGKLLVTPGQKPVLTVGRPFLGITLVVQ
jgi:hypothetical protein